MAQTKYLAKSQKGIEFNLEYDKMGETTTHGVQLGYSSEGRVGVGFLFGKIDSPQAKEYGAYLEVNLLKPTNNLPIGINTLMSYSRTSYSIDQDFYYTYPYSNTTIILNGKRTVYGQTIIVGIEAYSDVIKNKDSAFIP